ncbi:hypothetical protein EGH90_00335 [Kaistella haifensis]|nr:hypothetical protein EGH90_00335 [Kaistella haifensis]
MIIQASSIKGSIKGLKYQADDKGLSIEICRNGLLGDKPEEWHSEMRKIENFNHRSRLVNKRLSVVLSPSKEYSKTMTQEDWKNLADSYLDKLKIDKENHIYIAHLHQSTNENHVHLTISRCNFFSQNKISDNKIGERSGIIGDMIAKEKGWKTVKEISDEKRISISASLRIVLRTAKNYQELSEGMKTHGIVTQFFENEVKGVYGMKFIPIIDINDNPSERAQKSKQGYKLSEIPRNIDSKAKFRLPLIIQALEANHFKSLSPKEKTVYANEKNERIFGFAPVDNIVKNDSYSEDKTKKEKETLVENLITELLKPSYVSPTIDSDPIWKKKRKNR